MRSGRPFDECPLWSAVLEKGWSWPQAPTLHPAAVVEWQRRGGRLKRTWKLARSTELDPGSPEQAYARVAADLYRHVGDVTGARVIVDSSKRPSYGALLTFMDGVSPYFLHLVRDPRAVAYSLAKGKRNPDRSHYAEMARSGSVQGSALWVATNLGSEAVCRSHPPERVRRVSYEDFVADPVGVIKSTVEMVGEEPVLSPPFSGARTVRLGGNHTVSGNPSRFVSGDVEITEDDEWRVRMPASHRAAVSFLTSPFMRRYGYRAGDGAGQRSPAPSAKAGGGAA